MTDLGGRAVNPSTALARVIVDEFARNGVTDAVIAPGSRSAPLALALADAHARGHVRLHVRIDERSAGFLALGLAKMTGRPTPVITTSGTAVANLAPAVTEASYSGLPLVVISADRPHELRATGSSQTIDQVGFFGAMVRMAVDIPAAANRAGQVGYWRSTVARAVSIAAAPMRGGPVHLNITFSEPLVPPGESPVLRTHSTSDTEQGTSDAEQWCEPLDGRADGMPWITHFVGELTLQEPIDAVLAPLGLDAVPARGLVIVGDVADLDDADAAIALAETCGWPLHSEPSGNARRGDSALAHGALLLADPDFAASHIPDVVVTVGRVGLSRSVLNVLRRTPAHVAVDVRGATARPEYSDPVRTAVALLPAVPGPPTTIDDNVSALAWCAEWTTADARAGATIDELLGAQDKLTSLDVARLTTSAASGGVLFVASSRPVRDVEAMAQVRDDEPYVIGNRGVNGIDGLVSTAWGVSLGLMPSEVDIVVVVGLETDIAADLDSAGCIALLGDVAFLHDINGLLVPADEPRPDLVFVIVDNNGSGIFSSLEQGGPAYAEHFERVFGTPHGRDLVAVAAAYGVDAQRVSTKLDFVAALDHAIAAGGVQVVIADVGTREAEAALHAALQEVVTAALSSR